MRTLAFAKMNGLGNDFVVIDARREPVRLTEAQVRRIGDRRRGIGCDQLVLIEEAEGADARLTFFNPDGSEAGDLQQRHPLCRPAPARGERGDELALATGGGLLRVRRRGHWLAVEMAVPRFGWREIPLAEPCDTDVLPIDVPGLRRPAAVSMGNPHAVFIVEDVASVDVEGLGARLERHNLFPERANIGFAQVLSPELIRLRVFERGAGLTLACGSGACAALVTARRRGLAGEAATLILDGGELEVSWPGAGPVTMAGPAALVATGELTLELLDGRADG